MRWDGGFYCMQMFKFGPGLPTSDIFYSGMPTFKILILVRSNMDSVHDKLARPFLRG